jgi:hypothetical protein
MFTTEIMKRMIKNGEETMKIDVNFWEKIQNAEKIQAVVITGSSTWLPAQPHSPPCTQTPYWIVPQRVASDSAMILVLHRS